ncbi:MULTISPECIES: Swt1 family HEPN domain-containing protein [unclassified Bradyrhizobium]|uniref:Swt1 family HEPN domain-containing protein n=1 Tax=unclassified Bradyrhizobium TaxID=2631580 RepID=UPI0028E581BD|nr:MULTISPECIES: Swt1 family HEPN domain-containing protein [unclassified Bradyrhizobium]
MTIDSTASLFVMLGQTAEKTVAKIDNVVPKETLLISKEQDLAAVVPDIVRKAVEASEPYKLFFFFESYLRDLLVEVLSKEGTVPNWYEKVPKDVQDEVEKLEATEEMKSWMSLGSRDKSALLTLPQLLKVIEQNWKEGFDDLIRDKGLIQEARLLVHLRNTICHMSIIPAEEVERIKQTMRDWFRVVAP